MKKLNCFELQREIQKQTLLGEVLDEQIDANQISSTTLMKKLLISKYLQINRILVTEYFGTSATSDILNYIFISQNPLIVEDSFTSLDLPEDFSTVPVKTFMNTLFDSFQDFLPHFHNINPSKLPKESFKIEPSIILLRTVFPSLFAYCWAIEPANSYAKYLALWFKESLKQKDANFTSIFDKWLSQAVQGFFNCLNMLPFIRKAITPVFMSFVQIMNSSDKFKPNILLSFAKDILNNCRENYHLLPEAMNTFFTEFINVIQETSTIPDEEKENKIKLLIKLLFFDNLLKPIFTHPILYGLTDLPFVEDDVRSFDNIFDVYSTYFDKCFSNKPESSASAPSSNNIFEDTDKLNSYPIDNEKKPQEILSKPKFEISVKLAEFEEFQSFDPFEYIMEPIKENRASYPLPSLQNFCDIVQCAHQPLLFTTKTILILFRFICSIQHSFDFPKSIDRPIRQIIEQTLDSQLNEVGEMAFWFQCFSMSYLGIDNVSIKKKKKASPLYIILSNPAVVLNPLQHKAKESLAESLKFIGSKTETSLRTELLWILRKTESFDAEISKLSEEIDNVSLIIDEKRERSKDLNIFARSLSELIESCEYNGIPLAISTTLFKDYFTKFFQKSSSENVLSYCLSNIQQYLGNAFSLLGKPMLQLFVLLFKPNAKHEQPPFNNDDNGDETIQTLRNIVKRPLNLSAQLPQIMQLANDISTIIYYSQMNTIEGSIGACYSEPFVENPKQLAMNVKQFIEDLDYDVRKMLFTDREIQALEAFVMSFI